MAGGKLAQRWTVLWPMLALCLIAGSRWLLEGARPAAESTHLSQAMGCFGAAGIFASADLVRRRRERDRTAARTPTDLRWPTLRGALGGTCSLAGAGLAASLSKRAIHTDDATLALALTPCVIAVSTAALGSPAAQEMTARLWPGLAAVAGLLLLLPQPRIQDWRTGAALAAMPLLTGLGAALFAETRSSPNPTADPEMPTIFVSPYASLQACWLALLGAAVLHCGLAWLQSGSGGVFSMSSVTKEATSLDGTIAFLTTLTLLRAGAMRWSAQFLFVPLVALLEGVAFLRPELDSRSWLAFALLLISGLYLFFSGDAASNLSVR